MWSQIIGNKYVKWAALGGAGLLALGFAQNPRQFIKTLDTANDALVHQVNEGLRYTEKQLKPYKFPHIHYDGAPLSPLHANDYKEYRAEYTVSYYQYPHDILDNATIDTGAETVPFNDASLDQKLELIRERSQLLADATFVRDYLLAYYKDQSKVWGSVGVDNETGSTGGFVDFIKKRKDVNYVFNTIERLPQGIFEDGSVMSGAQKNLAEHNRQSDKLASQALNMINSHDTAIETSNKLDQFIFQQGQLQMAMWDSVIDNIAEEQIGGTKTVRETLNSHFKFEKFGKDYPFECMTIGASLDRKPEDFPKIFDIGPAGSSESEKVNSLRKQIPGGSEIQEQFLSENKPNRPQEMQTAFRAAVTLCAIQKELGLGRATDETQTGYNPFSFIAGALAVRNEGDEELIRSMTNTITQASTGIRAPGDTTDSRNGPAFRTDYKQR